MWISIISCASRHLSSTEALFHPWRKSTSSLGNEHIAYCWREIKKARSAGMEVRVHWVRSHSDHVLNAFADHAAVNARRCKQWGIRKSV